MPLDSEGHFPFTGPDDETGVRAWLLGRLPEEESAAIEERMFAEDSYYLALAVREDELIRDYLAGDLDSRDRADFERKFLATAALREKVRAVAALMTVAAERRAAAPEKERAWAKSWGWVPQAAFAVGLLLLAGVVAWQEWRIRATADSLRALLRKPGEPAKAADAGRGAVAEFALTPDLYRDSRDRMAVLAVPDDGKTVLFHLRVEQANRALKYRAALLRVGEDGEVWSGFVPAGRDPETADVALPAVLLRRADYVLTLDSASGAGHESYMFRVYRVAGAAAGR